MSFRGGPPVPPPKPQAPALPPKPAIHAQPPPTSQRPPQSTPQKVQAQGTNAPTSLTAEQRDRIRRDGYVVVNNVVSPALRDRAVRAINVRLGVGIKNDEAENFVNGLCFPDLSIQPVITDLFNRSATSAIVRSLVGQHLPVVSGQIAYDKVTFTPVPQWKHFWHLDGLTDAKERWAKKGTISNFTCLVGVALRDVPAPLHGNLTVLPGSHVQLEEHFRQNPQALNDLAERGDPALPRNLPFREAEQVCMKAGDIVIAHYQLAHSIAPNCSSDIRYVVYFRVIASTQLGYRPQAMTDIWLEWPGLRGLQIPNDPARDAALAAAVNEQLTIGAVFKSKLPYDPDRISELFPAANALFDAHDFAAALPLWRELADRQGDDFVSCVKVSVCYVVKATTTPNEAAKLAEEAEEYVRRAVDLAPSFPGSHGMLARFLSWRGQHEAALEAVEAMLNCPPIEKSFEWAKDLVGQGMRAAAVSCTTLKQPPGRIQNLRERALAKFPEFRDKIEENLKDAESEPLWALGKALMDAEPKDWKRLQEVFGKLSDLHPTNFWARLQAGAAFTYGAMGNPPALRVGEAHLRAALDADPLDPSPYGILARNLLWQGKPDQVLPTYDCLLSCQFRAHATPFILDSLRCSREAIMQKGQPQEAAAPLFARARATFPQISIEIERVNREKIGCVIF